jgi:hypothetical protein
MKETVSARIALLDNQIVDCDRLPIGRVDDLVIEVGGGGARVTALLTGSEALGGRIGGRLGETMERVSARLRPRAEPAGPPAVPVQTIGEVGSLIELDVTLDELPQVAGLERWLARYVERLPWSGDASE